MPFVRFDLVEGRSASEIKAILNATHSALVAAFKIPDRDRYQVVHEHPASHVVMEDTGLNISRSRERIFVQITTRRRTRRSKELFYDLLCTSLEKECGIAPSDVVVSMVTTTDEDWSFGYGRAQFLTGELGAELSDGTKVLAPVLQPLTQSNNP